MPSLHPFWQRFLPELPSPRTVGSCTWRECFMRCVSSLQPWTNATIGYRRTRISRNLSATSPIHRSFLNSSEATERKWIEFECIDVPRVDATNITFIGQVKSSDRKLVIKFNCGTIRRGGSPRLARWRGDGPPAPILWSFGWLKCTVIILGLGMSDPFGWWS